METHRSRHLNPPISDALPFTSKPLPVAETTPEAPEPISLRSPDDVLGALEWSVGETKALLQRAKATGDLRLQNQLLQTAIGALDKLAKSVGLYDDGVNVTVNNGETRILAVLDKLSDEELERIVRGDVSPELKALVGEVEGQ
jgi:hypothetical protein